MEFLALGSPRAISRAIEDYADPQRVVRALVVPWESDHMMVSMSVTASTGEGWAIEHANLGTITLTGQDHDRTRVTIVADVQDTGDQHRRESVLDRFADEIRSRFQVAS